MVDSSLQDAVPGMIIRGGTSNGFFVKRSDFPQRDGLSRDEIILRLFGSPDPIQIDGIGGSYSHTSKIMLVGESDEDGVDLEYTFGQVGIDDAIVDYKGNCGNLTNAIGVFGLLAGMISPREPTTDVTLHNTNTDSIIEQTVPVRRGEPEVYGEYAIDGVPGTGAKIESEFVDPGGSLSGSVFPTGDPIDTVRVDGTEVEISVVDVTKPNVFVRASDVGLTGTELPEDLNADPELLDRLEHIRSVVCAEIGLASSTATATEESPAIPQIAVISEPQSYDCSVEQTVDGSEITITSRLLSTQTPHHAYAVSGSICLAAATHLPGTIPHRCAADRTDSVVIGHPKGKIELEVNSTTGPDGVRIQGVTVGRTARLLLRGSAFYRPRT